MEAQGSCETCPSLGIGEMELRYVSGCLCSQNPPPPSDTGAVLWGPGWPLPQLPLLRAVTRDSHSPQRPYGCHEIPKPCRTFHIHFLTHLHLRGLLLLLLYRSGHRRRKSLSRDQCASRSLTASGSDLLCFRLPTSWASS